MTGQAVGPTANATGGNANGKAVEKFDPTKHLKNLNADSQGNLREPARWYLETKWRLVWLREDHPDAAVETEVYHIDDKWAVIKAVITLPNGGGSATGIGTAMASASARFSGRYVEKAETAALARACAALGYGTQFTAAEFEDGDYLSDSPTQAKARSRSAHAPAMNAPRPAPARETPTPQGAPVGQINDGQRRAIRAWLGERFGKDERAQCEWMGKIMPAALNETGTQIHLSPLTHEEGAEVLKKIAAERMRRAQRAPA